MTIDRSRITITGGYSRNHRIFSSKNFFTFGWRSNYYIMCIGCYVRERDESDLLLLIGSEAWFFENTCPNPGLVETVVKVVRE